MPVETYNLDVELFPSTLDSIRGALGDDYNVNLIEDNSSLQRRFEITQGKKRGVLTVFIKSGGKNSFLIQGNDDLKAVCAKCKKILIDETEVKIANKKSFSISDVPEEDFLILIDFLKEDGFAVEEKELPKATIKHLYQIKSKYRELVTITYFTNGRMLIQGATSRLLANLITYTVEALSDANISDEQKQFFEVSDAEMAVIDSEIRSHITVNFDKIDGKISTILTNSLLLLNHPIVLTDYSPCVFPALRALEGVLKKKLGVNGTIDDRKTIGNFYNETTPSSGIYVLNSKFTTTNPSLARYLEDAYNLYHRHRHTLFHFDDTIETTATITFDQSKTIVDEVLQVVSRICSHW